MSQQINMMIALREQEDGMISITGKMPEPILEKTVPPEQVMETVVEIINTFLATVDMAEFAEAATAAHAAN